MSVVLICLDDKVFAIPLSKVATELLYKRTHNYSWVEPRIHEHFCDHCGGCRLAVSTSNRDHLIVLSKHSKGIGVIEHRLPYSLCLFYYFGSSMKPRIAVNIHIRFRQYIKGP